MNPMDLLKNFQDMQGRMQEMQRRLKDIVVTGSSGGGMVKITMNGNMEVKSVSIAPEIVDPDDVGMLEDLVLAAMNSVNRELQESMKQHASELTGGLSIPGFPGM